MPSCGRGCVVSGLGVRAFRAFRAFWGLLGFKGFGNPYAASKAPNHVPKGPKDAVVRHTRFCNRSFVGIWKFGTWTLRL